MSMSGVTDTYHNDKKVLTATFNTLDGANQAVKALQKLQKAEKQEKQEKQDLLDEVNTVTLAKNAEGKLDIPLTSHESGRKGARIGALAGGVIGLIFPPAILATSALGAAVGGMTGGLRGTHSDALDAAEIKTMADGLEPGQSMLVSIVDPHRQEEVDAVLEGMATRISWTEMSAAIATALEKHGANH
jgi:uncharacterized membrane protein